MTARLPVSDADRHYADCMDLWVRWMRVQQSPRGFSGLDSVCGQAASNFMAAEDDSDIVYEKADKRLAEMVNACVESLMPNERLAIYIAHGLARQWPWPRVSMALCLELGTVTLRRLIAKRC